jgi:guanosine-3',5'-bis(diphosphate) 3'-pyrophosphohydrolase
MNRTVPDSELAGLVKALAFAAERHKGQAGKKNALPFIYHPIAVAEALVRCGGGRDGVLVEAAFLHDVLEETPTKPDEIASLFGDPVLSVVQEVTDDQSLPSEQRKLAQVKKAPHLSPRAKQIRIADKLCNIRDITPTGPSGWGRQRKREYLNWAEMVVEACQGCNPTLERAFQDELRERRVALDALL